jgi:hypothetical protein
LDFWVALTNRYRVCSTNLRFTKSRIDLSFADFIDKMLAKHVAKGRIIIAGKLSD